MAHLGSVPNPDNFGGVMARINMEGIADELDRNFARVLKAVLDEVAPGNTVDEKTLMRAFRTRLERGFERWEHVPDRYVDSGD
jgi:hypothetical protein